MSFAKNLLKQIDSEEFSLASEKKSSAEFNGFIDTGAYILNGALSGSLYGGFPNNKVMGLAGAEATGKTYFALGIVRNFLEKYKKSGVYLNDTEGATPEETLTERGIDSERVILSEPETVEEFRTKTLKFIEAYNTLPEKEREQMLVVLDSLGMLSTIKESEDALAGVNKRDMTRSQQIRGAFRTLRLKLAKAGMALIVTNHTYEVVGAYVPTKEMSGGGGLKYAADIICYLSKSKDRDTKDTKNVLGNIIKVTVVKNRFARENKQVEVKLSYTTGLDRYYGLIELGLKHGVFEQVSKKIKWPDGRTAFESVIYRKPEDWFTADVMEALELAANKEFKYGAGEEPTDDDEDEAA